MNTLLTLVALHFLCDFPLQGDFLARGKNHLISVPGVPWWLCLFAHAFIQAGAVALVLPWPVAALELFAHFVIDYGKTAGAFGEGERAFVIDQALHLGCKALYVGVFA